MERESERVNENNSQHPMGDAETLKSSLLRYFRGNPQSLPLKTLEISILETLVYFQGNPKF